MTPLLAQSMSNRDLQALLEAYWWLVIIALVGIGLVIGVMFWSVLRWMKRRELQAIERDRAERKRVRSAEHPDAWRVGAERYIDRDKLPEDVPYDTEPDPDDADLDDDPDADGPPPHGWHESDGDEDDDEDPYGLFEDKPYREPDDWDDDEDEDDDDDDDEMDEDDDEGPGP